MLRNRRFAFEKASREGWCLDFCPFLAWRLSVSREGLSGAAVFIDQMNLGTVQSDGTINLSTIAPGDRVIELRKDGFKTKQIRKRFVAGAPVVLAAADTALETETSEFKITFTPSDAQVALTRPGEASIRVTSGSPVSASPGTYTLSARTSDGLVRSAPIDVAAGQSRNLELSLGPSGMSKWDDPSAWKQENGMFSRKGGDYVLYGITPTSGTFVFSAMLTKGHRLQWVLHYTDPSNFDLFQIDDNNFYRADVRNGQKISDIKIPHKGEKKAFHTLQIRVSPTEIVHQIKQGDTWVVIDRCSQPGANLAAGRFGFYLPGGDQVWLANFGHYSDLNLH